MILLLLILSHSPAYGPIGHTYTYTYTKPTKPKPKPKPKPRSSTPRPRSDRHRGSVRRGGIKPPPRPTQRPAVWENRR